MASVIRNIEAIKKFFGDDYQIVVDKLLIENVSLSRRSTKFVNELIYPIANWVDHLNNGDINSISGKTISEITNEFNQWFHEYRMRFNTKDYIEKNQIIFDYRKNGHGCYWIDHNSHYDLDMMIRMENCGRVNYGDTLIELREQTTDSNLSHVVIVMNRKGVIFQIKGKSNEKPQKTHYPYIFDFLLKYNPITKITTQFIPENDLKLYDFSKNELDILGREKPHLFEISLL